MDSASNPRYSVARRAYHVAPKLNSGCRSATVDDNDAKAEVTSAILLQYELVIPDSYELVS